MALSVAWPGRAEPRYGFVGGRCPVLPGGLPSVRPSLRANLWILLRSPFACCSPVVCSLPTFLLPSWLFLATRVSLRLLLLLPRLALESDRYQDDSRARSNVQES